MTNLTGFAVFLFLFWEFCCLVPIYGNQIGFRARKCTSELWKWHFWLEYLWISLATQPRFTQGGGPAMTTSVITQNSGCKWSMLKTGKKYIGRLGFSTINGIATWGTCCSKPFAVPKLTTWEFWWIFSILFHLRWCLTTTTNQLSIIH